MLTNWLVFYEERRKFRQQMSRVSKAYCEWLAFSDTTKEIQKVEGLSAKDARKRLYALIDNNKPDPTR